MWLDDYVDPATRKHQSREQNCKAQQRCDPLLQNTARNLISTLHRVSKRTMKRKRSNDGINAESISSPRRTSPSSKVSAADKCLEELVHLSMGVSEDLKKVIRGVLHANGWQYIMLRDDWLQKSPSAKFLQSQQSKAPSLHMFVTSDGSMWLDHFYDNVAAAVFREDGVRRVIEHEQQSRQESSTRALVRTNQAM